MCGITGWIDWEEDLRLKGHLIEKMRDTLVARGPDDSGKWLSPCAAFGHRRLSVVDPAGGAQPMIREKNGKIYVICYNGELYNTPQLRIELERRGYTFRGHSDTEVLLCSYMEWGPHCIEKLNGIFAVAIWDEAQESLFLSRDRMGVKPLFYTSRGSAFLFGSEIKALLAHPAVSPIVGQEGLAEILIMGPGRTPGQGVFAGIHEVKPGYSLIYNRKGIEYSKYWSLESKHHTDNLETTREYIRWLMGDIIERQLVSDVPVCTLLSGGLDSSAITALASRIYEEEGKGQLHTYSIDYKDNSRYFRDSSFQPSEDRPWIQRVSGYLATVHHDIIIDTPQLAWALVEAMRAQDLPGYADIDSSLYLFSCEIKKKATVALSGECADEIFGGYPWFHKKELLERPMFPWVLYLDHRISLWKEGLFKEFTAQEYIEERYRETVAECPPWEGDNPLEAKRRQMFYLNMRWFMQALLNRKDRMSMAAGLEVRVPYSDHRLVEYVWNIPWEMKMHGGMSKGILRQALRGILPDDVLFRQKSPYPKTHNPAYTKAVSTWLESILDDRHSPLHELINESKIRSLLVAEEDVFNTPFYGQLMKGPQLFAYLIQLDIWLREYNVQIKL